MRYLWDHYHEYHDGASRLQKAFMPPIFHRMRQWDVTSATGIDRIVANSRFIRKRIKRAWGRDSTVVHPPVAVSEFAPVAEPQDYYLWVSQMTPYKRAGLAVEAFNRLGLPLLMIGDGEMRKDLERRASPNITIKSKVNFAELKHAYANARALVFTPEEDFGIVPVEANASGRPVIAFGSGGVTDSIVDGETGLFFAEQSVESLIDAVQRFDAWVPGFDPAAAVRNAQRFAPENFDRGIMNALSCA